jgi:hypothetical protein
MTSGQHYGGARPQTHTTTTTSTPTTPTTPAECAPYLTRQCRIEASPLACDGASSDDIHNTTERVEGHCNGACTHENKDTPGGRR